MFQNLLIIMGAVLAIIVYELQNTNNQEHQEADNSFTRRESITSELHTNLAYVDRIPDSFNEGYTVRLKDKIKILKDIGIQTSEKFENSEPPNLTDSDVSEDENQTDKHQIYQEQL